MGSERKRCLGKLVNIILTYKSDKKAEKKPKKRWELGDCDS